MFSHRNWTSKPDNICIVLSLSLLVINCYVTPVSALFGLRKNPKSKSNSTCNQPANHITENILLKDANLTFSDEAWRDKVQIYVRMV